MMSGLVSRTTTCCAIPLVVLGLTGVISYREPGTSTDNVGPDRQQDSRPGTGCSILPTIEMGDLLGGGDTIWTGVIDVVPRGVPSTVRPVVRRFLPRSLPNGGFAVAPKQGPPASRANV